MPEAQCKARTDGGTSPKHSSVRIIRNVASRSLSHSNRHSTSANPLSLTPAGRSRIDMPRLGSKKSRHGCVQCKARRVKVQTARSFIRIQVLLTPFQCDENRPCGACARYRVECSLLSTSVSNRAQTVSQTPSAGSPHTSTPSASNEHSVSPKPATTDSVNYQQNDARHYDPIFAPLEATTGEWMQDLELMHHYTAHAHMTMPGLETAKQIWGFAVPQEGFKHPHLMHSILAFSANHLAYINLSRASYYHVLASTHQSAALMGLNGALADLGPSNCHALFASASLTIMNAFADARTYSVEVLIEIFQLLRGMSFVLNTAVPWIENGPFAAIIRPSNADQINKPSALLSSFLVEIQAASYPTPSESVESQASRIEAAEQLRQALQYSIDNSGHPALRAAMTWPTTLEADFLEALKAGTDPKVRELMKLYCRLLEFASSEWWFISGWRGISSCI